MAGWWAMHATALPTATSPCNFCRLKSQMHNRPSRPVLTSTLLQASAAMPDTLLSCAAARRLPCSSLQGDAESLLRASNRRQTATLHHVFASRMPAHSKALIQTGALLVGSAASCVVLTAVHRFCSSQDISRTTQTNQWHITSHISACGKVHCLI